MFGKILNYGVKILIILIGIVLLSGFFKPDNLMVDSSVFRVMGVVFILYGIYRIIVYRNALRRYKHTERDD
jgi:nucleoside recognition membrane protein YjiH